MLGLATAQSPTTTWLTSYIALFSHFIPCGIWEYQAFRELGRVVRTVFLPERSSRDGVANAPVALVEQRHEHHEDGE